MKALAEEKYHHFKEMYGELGIETIISTHDRKEYDQDLERKELTLPWSSLRSSTLSRQ
jgi:replicative superfamily II helicase